MDFRLTLYPSFVLRLGLVIVILTVAVDPFSQQLLQLQQGIEYHDYLETGQYSNRTFARSGRGSTYYGGQQGDFNENSTSLEDRGLGFWDSDLRATQLEFAMEAAIRNSFAQSKDAIKQQSPTNCPTGNCTWDTFPTLGVCHRCKDLTSELEEIEDMGDFFVMMWGDQSKEDGVYHRLSPENATAFALPNGHFLPNVNGCAGESLDCVPVSPEYKAPDSQNTYALTSYSTGNRNKTVSMQDIETLITSMSVIYLDGEKVNKDSAVLWESKGEDRYERTKWPNAQVTAKECAVYFCIKEIEAEIRGNELIENAKEAESSRRVYYDEEERIYKADGIPYTLEFEANITQKGLVDGLYSNYSDLFLNYTNRDGVESTAEMDYTTYTAITEFLKETTKAKWENETKVLERVRERMPGIKEMFNGAIAGEGPRGFKPNALAGIWSDFRVDIEDKFESLATSMTNEIRTKGSTRTDDPLEPFIEGRIGLPRTAYRVVWYWFVLHGLILVGCAGFCVATMVLSRNVPVWKSHSLATMSQVPTVIDFGSEMKNLDELEKRAKSIEVSLSKDQEDGLLRHRVNRSESSEDGSLRPT